MASDYFARVKNKINSYCSGAFVACGVMVSPLTAATATFEYQGHGYLVDNVGVSWDVANATANAMLGGTGAVPAGWSNPHLVVINSAGENQAVLDGINGLGINTAAGDGGGGIYAWIGAHDVSSEGNFEWVDGSTFWSGGTNGAAVGGQYENWGSYNAGGVVNEPDDFGGQQDHAAISTTGWPLMAPGAALPGEWNDVNGSNNFLAYVVEFDVVPEPSSVSLLVVAGLGVLGRRKRC